MFIELENESTKCCYSPRQRRWRPFSPLEKKVFFSFLTHQRLTKVSWVPGNPQACFHFLFFGGYPHFLCLPSCFHLCRRVCVQSFGGGKTSSFHLPSYSSPLVYLGHLTPTLSKWPCHLSPSLFFPLFPPMTRFFFGNSHLKTSSPLKEDFDRLGRALVCQNNWWDIPHILNSPCQKHLFIVQSVNSSLSLLLCHTDSSWEGRRPGSTSECQQFEQHVRYSSTVVHSANTDSYDSQRRPCSNSQLGAWIHSECQLGSSSSTGCR